MTDSAIATAADYADAMFSARRFKNLLVLLILLMLLIQLGLFFAARYTDYVLVNPTVTAPTTTQSVDRTIVFQYLIGATVFLAVILSIVLSFVLLLIVNIMLVGRLIGVARTTSSYIWCLILIVLLFPWQAFLSNATFTAPEWKIPGVLYTWEELKLFARFGMDSAVDINVSILKWARFVVFPLAAIIIVLLIQVKSNRGLRQAFGESEPDLHNA